MFLHHFLHTKQFPLQDSVSMTIKWCLWKWIVKWQIRRLWDTAPRPLLNTLLRTALVKALSQASSPTRMISLFF
jgi:hypothetical protein